MARSPGAEVLEVVSYPCGYRELNPRPLQDQQMLLTDEQTPQPQSCGVLFVFLLIFGERLSGFEVL